MGGRGSASPGKSNGKFIGNWDDMNPAEKAYVQELLEQGHTVERIPTKEGEKTADFKVDGVETEYKKIQSFGKYTIKNGIEDAAEQTEKGQIVIDARNTPWTINHALLAFE